MEPIRALYSTPTWVTFVVTALIGLVAMEGGLYLGRRRADPEPEQGPVDTLTGGTVGCSRSCWPSRSASPRRATTRAATSWWPRRRRRARLYASLLPSPYRENRPTGS